MLSNTANSFANFDVPVAQVYRTMREATPAVLAETTKCLKKYLSEGCSLTTAIAFTKLDAGVSGAVVEQAISDHRNKSGGKRYQPMIRGHMTLTDNAYDVARVFEREKKLSADDGRPSVEKSDPLSLEIALTVRLSKIYQMDFIDSPEFRKKNAREICMGKMPAGEEKPRVTKRDKDLPAYLAALYDTALLTKPQEVHLFRQMNYIKFRIKTEARRLNPEKPNMQLLKKLESMCDQVQDIKNKILTANLRLAVNTAKRFTSYDLADDLFDRISDMNISLAKAIDKYDYYRGFKFSTYATWAMQKNYIRINSDADKRATRFSNAASEIIDETPGKAEEHSRYELEEFKRVNDALQKVSRREIKVVEMRLGLNGYGESHTLKEVGEEIGVTKERVRQIESAAIAKVREDLFVKDPAASDREARVDFHQRNKLLDKLERLNDTTLRLINLLLHTGASNEAEIKTTLIGFNKQAYSEDTIRKILISLEIKGFVEKEVLSDGSGRFRLTKQAAKLMDLIAKNAA